jgi:hypothetical protein
MESDAESESMTEVEFLRLRVSHLEDELVVSNVKVILLENKIQKLQDSEFRLEEELCIIKSDIVDKKKLIIGQSVLDLVCE